MMKNKVFWISAAVLSALSAGALAHSGATGIVKQRMDAMSDMGRVVKSLSVMMRGEAPYDADAISEGAVIIKSHAGDAMTSLFPEGSLKKPSVAKPEIWTDWSEFQALAIRLADLADGLELAAGNGLMHGGAQTGGRSGMMGKGGMMGTAGGMMSDGASGMMSGTMGDAMADPAMLARMPADGVFNMLARTCSDCHTKFRVEKK